jgi:orotate phosphoribosyltransferase
MKDEVPALLSFQRGHFLLESGHHGSMWMDLETLFLEPARIEPLAAELSMRLSRHGADTVCGPLVEGAFLALMVARHLGVPFTYSARVGSGNSSDLYPFSYRLPKVLHRVVRGKRVAIVNDVISAGSAVRGTAIDLEACGANLVAIGALLVLGEWSASFAAEKKIPLESFAFRPNEIWPPAECPLCAEGAPLERRIQQAQ